MPPARTAQYARPACGTRYPWAAWARPPASRQWPDNLDFARRQWWGAPHVAAVAPVATERDEVAFFSARAPLARKTAGRSARGPPARANPSASAAASRAAVLFHSGVSSSAARSSLRPRPLPSVPSPRATESTTCDSCEAAGGCVQAVQPAACFPSRQRHAWAAAGVAAG